MPKIYISPSDQYDNSYSYGGHTEGEICRQIGQAAYNALARCGYLAKLADASLDISGRIADSNAWGADYHICVHTNAGGGDGTLVLCYSGSAEDWVVEGVYNYVAEVSPGNDDGIRVNDSLAEINGTVATCVYLECEFHDNSTLAKWIVEHTTELGEAIAKGVCWGYGTNYISSTGNISIPQQEDDAALYRVQVGAFRSKENAENLAKELTEKGYSVYIKEG